MVETSIFTKIIHGDIPSHKIYEDNKTFAFLDINPIQPGHTLVVPKTQVDNLWSLEEADYSAVMSTCKKLANHLQTTLEKRVGVQVIGIDVPHAHVHLIPFSSIEEFRTVPKTGSEPNHEQLSLMAQKLMYRDD